MFWGTAHYVQSLTVQPLLKHFYWTDTPVYWGAGGSNRTFSLFKYFVNLFYSSLRVLGAVKHVVASFVVYQWLSFRVMHFFNTPPWYAMVTNHLRRQEKSFDFLSCFKASFSGIDVCVLLFFTFLKIMDVIVLIRYWI